MTDAVPSSRYSRPRSWLLLAGLALLAAACSAAPSDAPVLTVTPSGSSTAPSARQAADRDRALVRVVSVIPGLSRLDLFVENEKIANGVEYRHTTPYVEVRSGRQTLRLQPAGMDTAEPLAEETQQLSAGRHYTVVIMPGEEDGPAAAIRTFDDPMDAPDGADAKLRFVHAAADAGSLDVHMDGRADALTTALNFQRASDFLDVQPPATPIAVRPAGRSETMLRVPDLRLSSGGIYTVFVIGRARIEPPLDTLVLEDRILASP
jgi:hypothetical protein